MIKHNRYNSQWFYMLLVMFVLGACGKEMNQPKLTEPNHRVLYTSQKFNDNTINQGAHIDFSDVSRGLVSREWLVPSLDSVRLEGSTEDPKITIFFEKPGDYSIVLHQEFVDSVYSFRDPEIRPAILDTMIRVKVMPPVKIEGIKAQLVKKEGLVDLDMAKTNEIFTGSTVRYTYTALGEPNAISLLTGGTIVAEDHEANTFDVKYKGIDKVFDFRAKLQRNAPRSLDTTNLIPSLIKCIPSSDPVNLMKIINSGDDKVHVVFSRDMDVETLLASEFSVKITTAKAKLITPDFEVLLNKTDESIIVLKLKDEKIYGDDVVLVSYKAGELRTSDGVSAKSIIDVSMEHNLVNLLEADAYGFEDTSVEWRAEGPGWLGGDFTSVLTKSTEQVFAGANSLKISVKPWNGKGGANNTIIQPFATGDVLKFDYPKDGEDNIKVSAMVYVEENGGPRDAGTTFDTNMRIRVLNAVGFSDYAHPVAGTTTGKWTRLEANHKVTTPDNAPFNIALNIAQTGTENFTIYIDDIKVAKYTPRP